jgi:hypothetical protein
VVLGINRCASADRAGEKMSRPVHTPTPIRRPRGRPASKKDKNGLPVPVRADRDPAIQPFFEDIPRADLDSAMLLSGDTRFYRLHDALHDDAYRKTSPGTLCRKFGISWADLMRLWWDYNRYLGLMIAESRLPKILDDIARDSESRDEPCPRCDGIGHVMREDGEAPCPQCDGAGTVSVPGDAHARRLFFEIMGLIGPRRGGRA